MSRSEDYLDNLLTSVTDKLDEFDDEIEQNRESKENPTRHRTIFRQKRRVRWMKSVRKTFCVNLRMKLTKEELTMIFCQNLKGN